MLLGTTSNTVLHIMTKNLLCAGKQAGLMSAEWFKTAIHHKSWKRLKAIIQKYRLSCFFLAGSLDGTLNSPACRDLYNSPDFKNLWKEVFCTDLKTSSNILVWDRIELG